jgi:hypothetical protein
MGYEPGIYFVKSEDPGKSFNSPVRSAYNDSYDFGKSQVSVLDICVYVTWIQWGTVNKLGNLCCKKL